MRAREGRHEGFNDVLTSLREGASTRLDVGDPRQAASGIKVAAKVFGASVVGITSYDPRWHYSSKFSREKDGQGRAKANALVEADEKEIHLDSDSLGEELWYSMQNTASSNDADELSHKEANQYSRTNSGAVTIENDGQNKAEHELPNVIVIGQAMDLGLLSTVPSALSSAAVGVGYSHDALTLLTLSQVW
jgi:hypothetical protein